MIKPYWQDEWVTIYHGDCREILPELPKVDLVLTDPPYGLNKLMQGGTWGITFKNSDMKNWDYTIPSHLIDIIIGMSTKSIIWGGNYYSLPLSRGWLVWYKRDAAPSISDAELAWTNINMPCQLFDYPIAAVNKERNGHPTLKPVALFDWCLNFAPDAVTILDPFLGSGTTAVCAKKLGRKCIGIEIEEKYCEIAVKRLQQTVMNFEEPKETVKQESLL